MEPENREKKSLTSLASSGIVGNIKAISGIDRPSEEVIEKRWQICKNCEHNKFLICQECFCIISQKIKVASEKCPVGFWGKEHAE